MAADPKPWQGSALGIGPGTSFSEIQGSQANPLLPPLLLFPRLSAWVSGIVPRAQTRGFQANVGYSRICHCCVALSELLTSLCFHFSHL